MTADPLKSRYIAALDGLRALSIGFVIFSHSIRFLPNHFHHGIALGPLGVTIFFVISGYLITQQLVAEKQRTGKINIARFMLRRAFRLLPASLLMISVALILSYFGIVGLNGAEIIHGLTYTMNYYLPANHTLEHIWSLSVEEQFYLIWPVIVLLLSTAGSRSLCWFVIAACPALRAWGWYSGAVSHMIIFRHFEMICDALAIGCLLSIAKDKLPQWSRSRVLGASCLAIMFLDSMLLDKFHAFPIFGISLNSACAALLINTLTYNQFLLTRIFASNPLRWLGTISYSLYLWQQLFLLTPPHNLLLRISGALATATISFYLIERPIRDWGKRLTFSPVRSTPTPSHGVNALASNSLPDPETPVA